ncbi:hypothetical protein [Paenibacillus puerhi]|uniref:hypothetical protein n=1 Tax=Paenibacillus puerhi TaxID=2692622 RepID=UPI00135A1B0E|nr:hypothetical protein [Paenibacillus puerhi]
MDTKVRLTLDAALRNWTSMSAADEEEAEGTANEFEASFYQFIDAFRDWVNGLDPRPVTLEELLELPDVQTITDRLPAPLYLNFETEAELIVDRFSRVDDEKYD